jgi:hypothetical protein
VLRPGALYSAVWTTDAVQFGTTKGGPRATGEYDGAKSRTLPLSTSLEEIARIILEDVYTRPELLELAPEKPPKKTRKPRA